MNDQQQIAELTVGQLKALIRRTVQDAMTDVLMEFTLAAQLEAEVAEEAEMTEYLRATLRDRVPGLPAVVGGPYTLELDD
jgi:hypothetical protein